MIAGRKLAFFFTDKGQFFRPIKDRRSWTSAGWKEKGCFVVELYVIFLIPIFYWFFFVLRTLVISLAATKICFLAKKASRITDRNAKKDHEKDPRCFVFLWTYKKKGQFLLLGWAPFGCLNEKKYLFRFFEIFAFREFSLVCWTHGSESP